MAKRRGMVKRGCGLRGLRRDCVGASGDLAGHVGGRCTPVHPKKELSKDDGPRKGPQAIRGVRGVQGLSGVGASGFGFVRK